MSNAEKYTDSTVCQIPKNYRFYTKHLMFFLYNLNRFKHSFNNSFNYNKNLFYIAIINKIMNIKNNYNNFYLYK